MGAVLCSNLVPPRGMEAPVLFLKRVTFLLYFFFFRSFSSLVTFKKVRRVQPSKLVIIIKKIKNLRALFTQSLVANVGRQSIAKAIKFWLSSLRLG